MSTGLVTTITETNTATKDVSEQVQARLRRADDLEVALKELQETLDAERQSWAEKDTELRALRHLADQEDRLNAKERELDSREREMDLRKEMNAFRLQVMEEKMEIHKQRVSDHHKMVELIFRNTLLRKEKVIPVALEGGDVMTGYYDDKGQQIINREPGHVEFHSETETETAE